MQQPVGPHAPPESGADGKVHIRNLAGLWAIFSATPSAAMITAQAPSVLGQTSRR